MNKKIYKASIRRLMQVKVSAGTLLLVSAVMAIAVVNSSWGEMYEHILLQEMSLKIFGMDIFNHNGLPMTLASFIGDALMALFFLSIGLEIKREILIGELSTWRKAMLPVIAACGGMIIPVVFFTLVAPEGAAQRGAAIPMATDIAFSLAVLSLLGKRVPISLKIFLTAFAVVDDIGGIIVIALFYSTHLSFSLLFFALITLVLMYVGGKDGHYLQTVLYGRFFHSLVLISALRDTSHYSRSPFCIDHSCPSKTQFVLLYCRHDGQFENTAAKPVRSEIVK